MARNASSDGTAQAKATGTHGPEVVKGDPDAAAAGRIREVQVGALDRVAVVDRRLRPGDGHRRHDRVQVPGPAGVADP
jgi:hypothetical protein